MAHGLRHRWLVSLIAAWALWISVSPGRAWALPSDSVSSFAPASVRAQQIETVLEVLSRPEAQVHLRVAGMTPETLKTQLARLDDAQLAQAAAQAKTVKAGGILGVIIALLIIAILVVVLLWMVDKDVDVTVKDKD